MQHRIESLANALFRSHSLGNIAECGHQTNLGILAIKHGGDIDLKNALLSVNAASCEMLSANALAVQRPRQWELLVRHRSAIQSIGRIASQERIQMARIIFRHTEKVRCGVVEYHYVSLHVGYRDALCHGMKDSVQGGSAFVGLCSGFAHLG